MREQQWKQEEQEHTGKAEVGGNIGWRNSIRKGEDQAKEKEYEEEQAKRKRIEE